MIALLKTDISVQEALRNAVKTLQEAKIESASLDARLLLEKTLQIECRTLLFEEGRSLSQGQEVEFAALVAARAQRQPMGQLLGKREFWSLDFKVTADTLDPRADSEALIEAVMMQGVNRAAPLKILDMGTGTGCLILTLLSEYPAACGVAVDVSDAALAVASENAEALGLKNRVEFVKSDWNQAISGVFDIVISNPPYIATEEIPTLAPEVAQYEPKLALDGGADGLDCYRTIIRALPQLLAPDGLAVLEMGFGQLDALKQLVDEQPLTVVAIRQDLAGIARALVIKHTTKE